MGKGRAAPAAAGGKRLHASCRQEGGGSARPKCKPGRGFCRGLRATRQRDGRAIPKLSNQRFSGIDSRMETTPARDATKENRLA